MISDDAKVGLLDWLFGKRSLDKAAQQGTQPIPPNPPIQPQTTQDNSYVKKKIEEEELRKKTQKAAMDTLKKVK